MSQFSEMPNPPASRPDLVLVVDDSPEALGLVNDALEAAGIEVLVALEGRQALKIARKMKPDMILMDAMMPVMTGFEACQQLKQEPELAHIPVIFMTGLTDTADIVRGLEAGGVDYLTKPINPDELIARMRVHLGNARLANLAQSALDLTGQYLLTVNSAGELLWATPQSHALLGRTGLSESELAERMSTQLRVWLASQPDKSDELTLENLAYPLAVRFRGQQENGDVVLKLLDGNQPRGEAMLQQALGLTQREAEVLHWIANGKSNREAAEILGMSPRTVNKHLEQVFVKLGVENRTAAAGVALRLMAAE
ncbi:MAG: response regulator [Oceanobacter sp.]